MNTSYANEIRERDAANGEVKQLPHSEAMPPATQAAFEALTGEVAKLRATVRELVDDQPPQPERELLTVAETADYLRVSKRSCESLISAGELPVCDVGPNGGKRLIHRDNIDGYLRQSVRR